MKTPGLPRQDRSHVSVKKYCKWKRENMHPMTLNPLMLDSLIPWFYNPESTALQFFRSLPGPAVSAVRIAALCLLLPLSFPREPTPMPPKSGWDAPQLPHSACPRSQHFLHVVKVCLLTLCFPYVTYTRVELLFLWLTLDPRGTAWCLGHSGCSGNKCGWGGMLLNECPKRELVKSEDGWRFKRWWWWFGEWTPGIFSSVYTSLWLSGSISTGLRKCFIGARSQPLSGWARHTADTPKGASAQLRPMTLPFITHLPGKHSHSSYHCQALRALRRTIHGPCWQMTMAQPS